MSRHLALLKHGIFTFLLQTILLHQSVIAQNVSICAVRPVKCDVKSKYRSYDGYCNNLKHPEWGSTNSRYYRLLPSNYADGIQAPSVAKDGTALPNARKTSFTVYPAVQIEDHRLTLTVMQFGQVLAHDMSMTMDNNQTKMESDQCCSVDGQLLANSQNPNICSPILIPPNDPVYTKLGVKCFRFDRTGTDFEFGCGQKNKPRQQLTQVNHVIDLSLVYGQNDNGSKAVRLFIGGKLKFEHRRGQDWLPRNLNVSGTCSVVDPKEPCYLAGDIRANQSPQLTILQTILLRDHNRVADKLAELNRKWDDEKIFQEARKICIGQHQKIIYYDFLPYLLGKQNMLKRKLIYKEDGYINDYNDTVNPSVLNEHATAAFRFFHSNIAGYLDLVDEKRKVDDEARISDSFNRPRILEDDKDNFDDLTRGLVTQHQLRADEYHDKEITNNWARLPGKKIGLDLKAICIARGRDHGLATYNDFREYCGLPRAKKFKDFRDVMSKKNAQKLASLYKTPDDVDATVGGSLEELVPKALAGPTFLCIMTEQFYRTRVGDRFFFENSGVTGFSPDQLKEIKKASMSRLICDNTDVKNMQPDAFLKISRKNPLTSCKRLPSVNLHLWKE